jgi:hypothetical protein
LGSADDGGIPEWQELFAGDGAVILKVIEAARLGQPLQ